MNTISRRYTILSIVMAVSFLGFSGTGADAATITSISFKGGGCDMSTIPGDCSNADVAINGATVEVFKNFNKIESGGEGGCGQNEDGGEGGEGQKNGECSGKGGSSGEGGGNEAGETHEHETDFEKLAPIHMFITLQNSENSDGDTYFFTETITNSMNIVWDGFFFALKQNEDNRALFKGGDVLPNDYFTTVEAKGKKLTFSGGSYGYGLSDALEFGFFITFYDVDADLLKKDGTFSVMLQEFPLVSTPVPEPSTMLLFGIGLLALGGAARRRLKKQVESDAP